LVPDPSPQKQRGKEKQNHDKINQQTTDKINQQTTNKTQQKKLSYKEKLKNKKKRSNKLRPTEHHGRCHLRPDDQNSEE
jgi:hypothetical protein